MANRTNPVTYISVSSSQRKHIAEHPEWLGGMGVATAVPYLRENRLSTSPTTSHTKHYQYLIDIIKSGVPALIDSGAFEAYSKVVEPDWDKVFAEYEALAEIGGDNLILIAPDHVGEPWETAEMQAEEMDRIAELTERYGVQWIFPLQGFDPWIWSRVYRGHYNSLLDTPKATRTAFSLVALPMAAMRDDARALDKITDFLVRKAKWDLYYANELGHYPRVHYLGLGDMVRQKQIAIRQMVITGLIQSAGFRERWSEGFEDEDEAELIEPKDLLIDKYEKSAIRFLCRQPEEWWEDQLMLLYGLEDAPARDDFRRQLKQMSLSFDHSTLARGVSNYRVLDDTGRMTTAGKPPGWDETDIADRLWTLIDKYRWLDREDLTAAGLVQTEVRHEQISLF